MKVQFILLGGMLFLSSCSTASRSIADNSSSSCMPGDDSTCPSTQKCMKVYPSGQVCKPDEPVVETGFVLPFDTKTQAVCVASGTHHGTHAWENAFWAIDLANPYDQPAAAIYAAGPGRVFVLLGEDGTPCKEPSGTPQFAKTDSCGNKWGNRVKILHSNGYVSIYVHLETVLVKDGAIVKAGDPLGIEGWTGFAGHRHLHWSLQRFTPKAGKTIEDQIRTESGDSVPFSFQAVSNGAIKVFDTKTLNCGDSIRITDPGKSQPVFLGLSR